MSITVASISEKYTAHWKTQPTHVVRAPGRVNIIGEHIDYCGFGVFPIAITNAIWIALGKRADKQLHIVNVQNDNYPTFTYDMVPGPEMKIEGVSWYNYVLCGLKGVLESKPQVEITGLNMLIWGDIPKGAGLSSSSALVCCGALASSTGLNLELSNIDIANICAKSERYIGTEGGGMDQAISMLGVANKAKYIQFNPLRLEDVTLPEGISFVVINSMVVSSKAVGNSFNTRVAECRVSAQLLAKINGIDFKQIRTLGQLQDNLMFNLQQMSQLVSEKLHPEPYLRQEILDLLGLSDQEFIELSLSAKSKDTSSFHLHNRAKHVYTESKRVLDAISLCKSGEGGDEKIVKFGELMSQSHASCRDLYECSCPELDRICSYSLNYGALGARLTGAGWGGCAVIAVRDGDVPKLMENLKKEFFSGEMAGLDKDGLFVTCSSQGSQVFIVE